MSEAYVHGFNLVLEGVRQIRGTSTGQVDGADVSLVTSGEGVPTSAILLRARHLAWNPGLLPDSEPTAASSGPAPRAASCSCRCARRADGWRMPPRPMCPVCRSTAVRWEPTSGLGTIWSFVVPHPPLLPAYAALAPYNVIVVALERTRRSGSSATCSRHPKARSTRSTRRRSSSANRSGSCSSRSRTWPSPAGCADGAARGCRRSSGIPSLVPLPTGHHLRRIHSESDADRRHAGDGVTRPAVGDLRTGRGDGRRRR